MASHSEIQTRIVKTLLSYPPRSIGIWAALAYAILNWAFSELNWQQPGWDFMVATPQAVFTNGEWWRLWTTTVIHSDVRHFLSNISMGAIWMWLAVGYYGFGPIFLGMLIMAPPIYGATLKFLPPESGGLIGASGLVYFLGGVWLVLFVLLDRRRGVFNRIVRAIGVGLIIFFPTSFDPAISYRCHFYGFLAGLLWGTCIFLIYGNSFRRLEVKQVIEPDPPEVLPGPQDPAPPTFH